VHDEGFPITIEDQTASIDLNYSAAAITGCVY